MAETKSYRISEETQKRLEELSAEIGGNKDRVFNALMDTYAIQRETSNTAEDGRERIERFQQYAQYLVEAYIDSLKDVSAAEDRIRTEFRAQLQTQADAVITYKKQSEEVEKKASEAIQKASALKETTDAEKERLEMQIAGLKAELAAAAEKAIATEEICSGYKAQIAALRTVESERDHYRDLIQEMQKKSKEAEAQITRLQQKMQEEENGYRSRSEAEKETARARESELREHFEVRIEQLRAEYTKKENSLHSDKDHLYQMILSMQKESARELKVKEEEIAEWKRQLSILQVNQKTIIEDEMQSRESTIGKNEVPNRKSTISESEEQDETLTISEGREQDQNRAEPVNP